MLNNYMGTMKDKWDLFQENWQELEPASKIEFMRKTFLTKIQFSEHLHGTIPMQITIKKFQE